MAMKLTRSVRNFAQMSKSFVVNMSSGHVHHKSPVEVAKAARVTLNDIPVPSGSWQQYNSQRNARWNILLGASVVTLLATAFIMKESHVFYLHDSPDFKSVKINAK